MRDAQPHVWQTDTSVSDYSWGYADNDTFKSPAALICMLIDNTAKNGILMLNFGPKADGTVPEECLTRLLEMGKWLKANGEAIYATRPWTTSEEGTTELFANHKRYPGGPNDIRYTRSKDSTKIYATVMGLPGKPLTLLNTRVDGSLDDGKVTMLANGKLIDFSKNEKGQLVLDLSSITSENAGCKYAYSFRIEGLDLKGLNRSPYEMAKYYLKQDEPVDARSGDYDSKFPYLSGLKARMARSHRGERRDQNYFGKKIMIGGKSYEKGLMVCPAGSKGEGFFIIETKGLPEIKRFTADVGIDDRSKNMGSSTFIVEARVNGEWKRLYESRVLTGRDKPEPIDIEIPAGASHLSFLTTDGGDGGASDHAVWAGAKFH